MEVGKLWSEALGKKITVAPNNAKSLDRLEKHIGSAMRPEWGRDVRMVSVSHPSVFELLRCTADCPFEDV